MQLSRHFPDCAVLLRCDMQVPANSVADVQLLYKPGSYKSKEEGTVCISSQAAGSYEYVCIGQVGFLQHDDGDRTLLEAIAGRWIGRQAG